MIRLLFFFTITVVLFSCKKDMTDTNWTYQTSKVKHSFLSTSRQIYLEKKELVNLFSIQVSDFTNTPLIFRFNRAKLGWTDCYSVFNKYLPMCYMKSTFENPFEHDLNRINQSAFDISYIDYTNLQPNAGIIKDETTYPTISEQMVEDADQPNGIGDNRRTLGFHSLEFLLWGEDLSLSEEGQREHYDFVGVSGENFRRRIFLAHAKNHLIADLSTAGWSTAFENDVLKATTSEFLSFLFTGLVNFLEQDLAEKTLLKPYQNQNVDLELCRFSDETWKMIYSKVRGVKLLLDGRELFDYAHNDYFLEDLLYEVDGDKMISFNENMNLIEKILSDMDKSFDEVLMTEPSTIKQLYDLVMDNAKILRELAAKLDVTL